MRSEFHSIKSAFEEEPEITEDLALDCAQQLAAKLNEANNLLKQTIEVLEGFPLVTRPIMRVTWWKTQAMPLLDNLKALKNEGTE